MEKSPMTDAYWAAYRAANPSAPADYRLIWFGANELNLADELAEQVLHGTKRATTCLLIELETGREPVFPKAGDLWLLVDGKAAPRGVLQTVRVDIERFCDVDRQFAWDEGEDDRSLESWRRAHIDYFTRQGERLGFVFDETMKCVLERFRIVWPAELADR